MIGKLFDQYPVEHYQQYFQPCSSNNVLHRGLQSRMKMFLDNYVYFQERQIIKLFKAITTKLHMALIVKNNKILAHGQNIVASPSNGGTCCGSKEHMHAEKNAIRNLKNIYKLNGAQMIVFRIGKQIKNSTSLQLQYSQPCLACTKLLTKCMNKYGLKTVFFSF
jgi:tRNA(Arg) A34 adenosine deaminase TadA